MPFALQLETSGASAQFSNSIVRGQATTAVSTNWPIKMRRRCLTVFRPASLGVLEHASARRLLHQFPILQSLAACFLLHQALVIQKDHPRSLHRESSSPVRHGLASSQLLSGYPFLKASLTKLLQAVAVDYVCNAETDVRGSPSGIVIG